MFDRIDRFRGEPAKLIEATIAGQIQLDCHPGRQEFDSEGHPQRTPDGWQQLTVTGDDANTVICALIDLQPIRHGQISRPRQAQPVRLTFRVHPEARAQFLETEHAYLVEVSRPHEDARPLPGVRYLQSGFSGFSCTLRMEGRLRVWQEETPLPREVGDLLSQMGYQATAD